MIIERYDSAGILVSTEDIPDPPVSADAANARTLNVRLRTHLQRNRDFLALTAPTAAERNVQVARLTRQVSALIRLQLGALDETEADD